MEYITYERLGHRFYFHNLSLIIRNTLPMRDWDNISCSELSFATLYIRNTLPMRDWDSSLLWLKILINYWNTLPMRDWDITPAVTNPAPFAAFQWNTLPMRDWDHIKTPPLLLHVRNTLPMRDWDIIVVHRKHYIFYRNTLPMRDWDIKICCRILVNR